MLPPRPSRKADSTPRRRVLVAVAPNGARRTRADHPALPMTSAELARTAATCAEVGAAMIHVHVRGPAGEHILDADAARHAVAAIRATVGDRMGIQVTSEAAGRYGREEQMAFVRALRPRAVSLALRELCPDETSVAEFGAFLASLAAEDVDVQHILHGPADAARMAGLVARGVIPDEPSVLFVLGRYGHIDATPGDLLPFLENASGRFARFMVCAFGRNEAACVTEGALAHGDVRVGFENNLWLPDGHMAPDNAALVAVAVASLERAGLDIETASDRSR